MSADAQVGLGWTGRVMQVLQAAWTLVAVNLLFAAGVIVGLGVFGIMPASVAAASVLLGTSSGGTGSDGAGSDGTSTDNSTGTVRAFVREYRGAFVRANLAGIPFLIAAALLIADSLVLPNLAGPAAAALTALTTVLALLTLLAWIVTITLLVSYRDTPLAVLRYAVTLPLAAPLLGVGVLVVVIAFGVIAAIFPVVIPLVGASLPLAVAVRLVDHRLAAIDARHPASVDPVS